MARPLRVHLPGILYHVMSRGNNKQPIFIDDEDYVAYLTRLELATARFGVTCLAFCLLPNHVHLLLRPAQLPISRMMHHLNSGYCQAFNKRHERIGHVLQGRFLARLVDNELYRWRVVRYIVRNPVAAGLTETAEAWRWSSFGPTAGLTPVPRFLDVGSVWAMFDSKDTLTAQVIFRAFASSSADDGLDAIVDPQLSPAAKAKLREQLAPHTENEDFVYAERFASRPPLERALRLGPGENRAVAATRAFSEHAYTLRAIAVHFGCSTATVWTWIRRQRGATGSDLDFSMSPPRNRKSRSDPESPSPRPQQPRTPGLARRQR